jgi:prephenate dehydrogenase
MHRQFRAYIIGLGQIGGSLGYDLVASPKFSQVIGYDISPRVRSYARRHKAVSRTVGTLDKGIKAADIIILAVPIRESIRLLPEVCMKAGDNKIIIDVTTTKNGIFRALNELNCRPDYFSCHPLCGTEKEGIASARPGLFRNSDFMIIPAESARAESRRTVLGLVKSIKARPIFSDIAGHDLNIALTINLPYAIAVSLSSLAGSLTESNPGVFRSMRGSFRGATRVARSSPILTLDMLLTNTANVDRIISAFMDELKNLKKLIKGKKEEELSELINRAKRFSEKAANG